MAQPERPIALVEDLVQSRKAQVRVRVDRLFAVLMLGQWLSAIALVAYHEGFFQARFVAAFVGGGALSCASLALAVLHPGHRRTGYVNAVAQMLWSVLLVLLTAGWIDARFHVFVSLAALSLYRDWRVLAPATALVFVAQVFAGMPNPDWPRLLEHTFWILLVDAFLVTSCIWSSRDKVQLAKERLEAETLSAERLRRIQERTQELANAQEQLVAAERLSSVGTLAAGVAHEINNPLAFILGNVDYAVRELRSTSPDVPETITALDEARVGGTRVRDIVRDLKLFARTPPADDGTTRVEPLLERSVAMAANEIRHRAKLVRVYGGVSTAKGAETRLGQVFLNLLINAAQAIPEGNADANEIRITTRTVGTRIEVEIADTGCGIPEDVRGRIFEPFFTTKPIGVGTGLGLSICHGIVRSVGGDIAVESAVGVGTAFRVTLQAAGNPAANATAGADATARDDARDILIIDDEPLLARSLRRALAPHRVIAETSGRSALVRLASGQRFDLVICDVMMPEMSGPEVFEEMERLIPEQAKRVVFLTGGAFTAAAREFLAASKQPLLDKPADKADLLRILDATPPLNVAARRRPTLSSLSGGGRP